MVTIPKYLEGQVPTFAGIRTNRYFLDAEKGEIYIPLEEVEKDWNYYSKSWHRAHGPKVTVTRRYVEVRNEAGVVAQYDVERWAGNWFMNVVARHTGTEGGAWQKGLKHVQLDKRCHVEQVEAGLYQRRMGGVLLDYVAVSGAATYHADTKEQAQAELENKLSAPAPAERVVNWAVARRMGFCETGILQFCEDNGLSPDVEMTISELRNVVVKRRKSNCIYEFELAKLGINLNCR